MAKQRDSKVVKTEKIVTSEEKLEDSVKPTSVITPEGEFPKESNETQGEVQKSDLDLGIDLLQHQFSQTKSDIWGSKTPLIVVGIFLYLNEEGKLTLIMDKPLEGEVFQSLKLTKVDLTASFTLPGKKDIDKYRDKSSRWNEDAQALLFFRPKIERFIIVNHLKKLVVGGEIKVDLPSKDSFLSKAEEDLVYDLHPTILENVLKKFFEASLMVI
jgi:hypothetical protein